MRGISKGVENGIRKYVILDEYLCPIQIHRCKRPGKNCVKFSICTPYSA